MSNSVFLDKQYTRIIKLRTKELTRINNKFQMGKLLTNKENDKLWQEMIKTPPKDFKKTEGSGVSKGGLKS